MSSKAVVVTNTSATGGRTKLRTVEQPDVLRVHILNRCVGMLLTQGEEQPLGLDEVEALIASDALVAVSRRVSSVRTRRSFLWIAHEAREDHFNDIAKRSLKSKIDRIFTI